MKKIILFFPLACLFFAALMSCKNNPPENPLPATPTCTRTAAATGTPTLTVLLTATITSTEEAVPTSTMFVVFDDFSDGDSKSDGAVFGGCWYTYDDLAESTDNIVCGDTNIWPMSAGAGAKYYGILYRQTPVPTFIMSGYAATSETPPPGVTSGYYARVSGTVNRAAYPYGYAGLAVNLKDNGDPSGASPKIAVDMFNVLGSMGLTRISFWYKNGPSLDAGAEVPWKVKLATSAVVGTGPCVMEDADNYPVMNFTSTSSWQKFDQVMTNFAPEPWGATVCGARSALSTCISGAVSYINGGNWFKCSAAQALAEMNAVMWQTNFTGGLAAYFFDLEIAQVEFMQF